VTTPRTRSKVDFVSRLFALEPGIDEKEAKAGLRRFPAGSAMERGEYQVHYHYVREFLNEFPRIRPAMSVVEKAGYGKTKGFGLTGFIPYYVFWKHVMWQLLEQDSHMRRPWDR